MTNQTESTVTENQPPCSNCDIGERFRPWNIKLSQVEAYIGKFTNRTMVVIGGKTYNHSVICLSFIPKNRNGNISNIVSPDILVKDDDRCQCICPLAKSCRHGIS